MANEPPSSSSTAPPHFQAAPVKPSSSPSLTFAHTISEKLDTKNYLLGCQQVEPVIKGHRLHHFLVNPQILPKFLTVSNKDENRVSKEYLAWEQQDQLLLSWLQSSMSKDMLARVIGCKSSFQIWDKIHAYFHAHTNAKARQLHSDLRSTTLDNCTISDYLLRIQSLVDSLTAIGDSVSSKEHLDIVLEGLPGEYESTVSLISSRFDVLSIEEVETLLLAHEFRLEKFKKKNLISVNLLESSSGSNTPALQPQANLAHQDSQFPSFRGGRPSARSGCGGRSNHRYGRGRGRVFGTQC
uniref:Retrovirus-related Pol polyprotein from transposon TNT 1-94 n=1 Tax=Cajanus cajan TaxID=3821 RepID=A0A151R5W2_CAJCA|nr:hypothetical protein KK1_040830 [Cajanus cajan]